VIAGAVIALAVQLLLTMLGTGIGASTLDTTVPGNSPTGAAFGTGAAVWWAVSSLLALLAGGFVAGRLSGVPRSGEGGLHGLLTWAVSILVIVYLVSSTAGALMRGAAGVLGTAANVTATGIGAAAPKLADAAERQLNESGISFDSIKQEAMKVLSQTGKPELQPGNVAGAAKAAASDAKQVGQAPSEQNFGALLDKLLTRGKDVANEVDREALVNVVMSRNNVSREEATKQVAAWEQTATQARAKAEQAAEEARVKAREVADASAKGVSRAMLLGALALALGGLVAWWGGTIGQRRTLNVR
jgi:hypothetical protein